MKKRRVPRKRLLNYVNKYKKKLGLDDYEIDIIISEDKKYIATDHIEEDNSARADTAKTSTESDHFTIVFYDFSNLESDVIHELIHVKFWNTLDNYESEDIVGDLEHEIIDLLIPTYMSK